MRTIETVPHATGNEQPHSGSFHFATGSNVLSVSITSNCQETPMCRFTSVMNAAGLSGVRNAKMNHLSRISNGPPTRPMDQSYYFFGKNGLKPPSADPHIIEPPALSLSRVELGLQQQATHFQKAAGT
jgi:hypothetical protein